AFAVACAGGDEGGFDVSSGSRLGNAGEAELFGEWLQRFEGAAAFGERLIEETFAIPPEQVERDVSNWHFFSGEQIEFAAAEALLEFRKGKSAIPAHRKEFAVKDEVDGKGFCGVHDIEER